MVYQTPEGVSHVPNVVLNAVTANSRPLSDEVGHFRCAAHAAGDIDDRASVDSFRTLVEYYPDAIFVLRGERVVYVNAAAVRRMAAETGDDLVGRHVAELLGSDALPTMRARCAVLGKFGDASDSFDAKMLRLDGSTLAVEAVAVLTRWGDEPAYQVIFRASGGRELDYQKDFAAIAHLLDEGIIVMRRDGELRFINRAAMAICGLRSQRDAAKFIKRAVTSPYYNADGALMAPDMHPAALRFRRNVAFSKEIFGIDLPTGRRWVLANGRLIDPGDPDSDVLVSISDVTAEREDLDRLNYQANHDPLTGLPNRAFALRRITESLESTGTRRLTAVLFIDLDDLKTTNDTLGHHAGDELLIAAGERLREGIDPTDLVGRHGGDEFVVLIFGPQDLHGLGDRLRMRLAQPLSIAGTMIPIRASVGIVEVNRDDGRSAEEILRDADRAMYEAKRARRNLGR